MVEGEMHADMAVCPELLKEHYPFSTLTEAANVLICPDLNSGNIAFKLLERLGGADAIGPILMGLKKTVHILLRTHDVSDIVNIAAIAAVEADSVE